MKTVNLQLSKQLKEAGFPQESDCKWNLPSEMRLHPNREVMKIAGELFVAAPTAEEVMDLLPQKVVVQEREALMEFYKMEKPLNHYKVCYAFKVSEPIKFIDESLADAAAKMYLYLAENHLLTETKQEKSEAV